MGNSAVKETCRIQNSAIFDKKFIVLIAAALLVATLPGRAQDQATLVGTVTDPSGSAVPNCNVRIANSNKGFTRELVTNSAGEYTAAAIPIGDYVITAQATGFRELIRSGITLQVGQTLRMDLQLTLGATTQEVSVSGSVTKVETENAVASDMVNGGQIQNLNLNGRNY